MDASAYPKTPDGRTTRMLIASEVVERGDFVQNDMTGELREYTGPVGRRAGEHAYPIFRPAETQALDAPMLLAISYEAGQLVTAPGLTIDEAIEKVLATCEGSDDQMQRYTAGLAKFIRNALADARVLYNHMNVTPGRRDEITTGLTGLAFTKEHLDA